MSTEFVSTLTDEIGFVRWGHVSPCGARTSFEFGTISNFEAVCAGLRAGEEFTPIGISSAGDPATVEDIESMVVSGRATFGEFPITVALGSGEGWRLTVEE